MIPLRVESPAVSVIVPVYNAARYLNECVNSIRDQTLSNVEIILVNDGSGDESGSICDEYAALDSRIIVIHKENGGAACARNAGLSVSKGAYVYFVDADDWIEPTTIERSYSRAAEGDYDVLVFGYIKESGSGQKVLRKSILPPPVDVPHQDSLGAAIPRFCDAGGGLMVWNKLFRRSMLVDHGIWFERMKRGEDMSFMLDVFRACGSIGVVREDFYHYRIYPHAGQYSRQSLDDHIYVFNKYLRLIGVQEEGTSRYYHTVRLFARWFAYVIPMNIVANSSLRVKDKVGLLREIVESKEVDYWLNEFKGKGVGGTKALMLTVMDTRNPYLIYALSKAALFARRRLKIHLR